MSCVEILSILSNIFTVLGVIFAVLIYFLWQRDYGIEQAHEYALTLLKKVKCLHLEIELLRRPKFYNPKTLVEDMEKNYIPQIEKKILTKLIEIQVDLLVAEASLVKNKNLQLKFNETVQKKIIIPINTAVYMFFSEKSELNFDVKKSELFKVIFPSEVRASDIKIKKSMLGTGMEIIDDKFNEIIQDTFSSIYFDLESNLASSTVTRWIKKLFKKIFAC